MQRLETYIPVLINVFGNRPVRSIQFHRETYILWCDLKRWLPARLSDEQMKQLCPDYSDAAVILRAGRSGQYRLIVPKRYIGLLREAAQRIRDRQERMARAAQPAILAPASQPPALAIQQASQPPALAIQQVSQPPAILVSAIQPAIIQPLIIQPPMIIQPLVIDDGAGADSNSIADALSAIAAEDIADEAERNAVLDAVAAADIDEVLGVAEEANREDIQQQEDPPELIEPPSGSETRRVLEIIDLVTPPESPVYLLVCPIRRGVSRRGAGAPVPTEAKL